jgi:FtsH-binding integral membrane protein
VAVVVVVEVVLVVVVVVAAVVVEIVVMVVIVVVVVVVMAVVVVVAVIVYKIQNGLHRKCRERNSNEILSAVLALYLHIYHYRRTRKETTTFFCNVLNRTEY